MSDTGLWRAARLFNWTGITAVPAAHYLPPPSRRIPGHVQLQYIPGSGSYRVVGDLLDALRRHIDMVRKLNGMVLSDGTEVLAKELDQCYISFTADKGPTFIAGGDVRRDKVVLAGEWYFMEEVWRNFLPRLFFLFIVLYNDSRLSGFGGKNVLLCRYHKTCGLAFRK